MAEHWNGGNGGKGSKPRPYGVPLEVFDENMDRIFNNEEKQRKLEEKKKADAEYWAKIKAETTARLAEANKKDK